MLSGDVDAFVAVAAKLSDAEKLRVAMALMSAIDESTDELSGRAELLRPHSQRRSTCATR